jgi:hypothetical protein
VGHNLSIDFVKKPTKRGYRVNIRPCKKPFKGYDARGAYRFPQYLTKSTCWIRPDGVAEDIKENKNNNQQQAADEMLDWRPFMEALYNQLGLSE